MDKKPKPIKSNNIRLLAKNNLKNYLHVNKQYKEKENVKSKIIDNYFNNLSEIKNTFNEKIEEPYFKRTKLFPIEADNLNSSPSKENRAISLNMKKNNLTERKEVKKIKLDSRVINNERKIPYIKTNLSISKSPETKVNYTKILNLIDNKFFNLFNYFSNSYDHINIAKTKSLDYIEKLKYISYKDECISGSESIDEKLDKNKESLRNRIIKVKKSNFIINVDKCETDKSGVCWSANVSDNSKEIKKEKFIEKIDFSENPGGYVNNEENLEEE
jgi:hypothetical protein